MLQSVLKGIRRQVIESRLLLRLVEPLVNLYRYGIVIFGPKETTLQIAGLSAKYHLESFAEVRHFYPIFSNRDQLSDFLEELQPDDVVYDIGAHIGIYSCFAAKSTGAHVIAFEPHPENVARLRENLQLNGVTADLHPVALSDESARINFSIDSAEPGAIGHLAEGAREESVEVEMVRGDDYVAQEDIPLPDVVKIDVEGAELKVLRGLQKSLSECRVIYCEVSDQIREYGGSKRELREFFEGRGFEVEYFDEDTVIHDDLKAVRT